MTFIVRVICRVNFKTVEMCEKFIVQSLILSSGRDGLKGSLRKPLNCHENRSQCLLNMPDSEGTVNLILLIFTQPNTR
jgi:hypothetical protein